MIQIKIKTEPDIEYDEIIPNVKSSRPPLETTQNSDSELGQNVIKEEKDNEREEMEVPPNFPQSMELAEDKKVKCYLFCSLCHYKTKSHDIFVQHQLIHNILETQKHHCKICSFKTESKELFRQHNWTHWHDDVEYPCSFCHFKTKHKMGMNLHMKIHDDESALAGGYFYLFGRNNKTSEEFYECFGCSHRSGDKEFFKSHVEEHKKIALKKSIEKKKTIQIIKCPYCLYKTSSRVVLCTHVNKDHNNFTENYLKEFTKMRYNTRSNETLSKETKDLLFNEEGKRRSIKEMDELFSRFRCEFCTYSSWNKLSLAIHASHAHGIRGKKSKIKSQVERRDSKP